MPFILHARYSRGDGATEGKVPTFAKGDNLTEISRSGTRPWATASCSQRL